MFEDTKGSQQVKRVVLDKIPRNLLVADSWATLLHRGPAHPSGAAAGC